MLYSHVKAICTTASFYKEERSVVDRGVMGAGESRSAPMMQQNDIPDAIADTHITETS